MKYPKNYFRQLAARWRERQSEQKHIRALAKRARKNAELHSVKQISAQNTLKL